MSDTTPSVKERVTLVERLRFFATQTTVSFPGYLAEAADEIERLEQRYASLLKRFESACGEYTAARSRIMDLEDALRAHETPAVDLRAAFEQWCYVHGSGGADSSEWYWRLFQAGAKAQRRADEPTAVDPLPDLIDALSWLEVPRPATDAEYIAMESFLSRMRAKWGDCKVRSACPPCVWRDGCRNPTTCAIKGHCDAPPTMRAQPPSDGLCDPYRDGERCAFYPSCMCGKSEQAWKGSAQTPGGGK